MLNLIFFIENETFESSSELPEEKQSSLRLLFFNLFLIYFLYRGFNK